MDFKNDIVIGMGEVLWDVLPAGKKIGGAPANFAYHITQFGLPGCVVSAVGHDALGREIIDNFSAKGFGFELAEVPYPTGTVQVELDGLGIPHYDITENVAWDHIPFTDELLNLAGRTKAFCFGSLAQRSEESRTTINRFLDAMAASGSDSLVVFDVNLRQSFYSKEILHESMKRCNILKINDEELIEVSGMYGCTADTQQEQCKWLLERYDLHILILTCGINGSYVFTREGISYLPTPEVEVADTVGAGDSFTAAFIASLLKGKTVAEAHATAVQTSAFVCSCHGATPPLPADITGERLADVL